MPRTSLVFVLCTILTSAIAAQNLCPTGTTSVVRHN